jgi:hypothetical protein
MMKTMFALLLIAGIVLAAQVNGAFASENAERAGARDWWQRNFGHYLAAHSFADVPWLDHLMGAPKRGGSHQLQLGMPDALRLHPSDTQRQTTASGAFESP